MVADADDCLDEPLFVREPACHNCFVIGVCSAVFFTYNGWYAESKKEVLVVFRQQSRRRAVPEIVCFKNAVSTECRGEEFSHAQQGGLEEAGRRALGRGFGHDFREVVCKEVVDRVRIASNCGKVFGRFRASGCRLYVADDSCSKERAKKALNVGDYTEVCVANPYFVCAVC